MRLEHLDILKNEQAFECEYVCPIPNNNYLTKFS